MSGLPDGSEGVLLVLMGFSCISYSHPEAEILLRNITTLPDKYFHSGQPCSMSVNQTSANARLFLSTPLRHLHRSQTSKRRKGSMAAQGKQVQEWKGDIVVDDKDSKKTAAASSRGLAGLPERPEDMPQSTPAASPFMQVGSST